MMKSFLSQPIRIKLLGIILVNSIVALILSMAAIAIYDLKEYTSQRIRELNTQAAVIGNSSMAALEFNDVKTATEYLTALRFRERIDAAALYDANRKLFASFTIHDARYPFPAAESSGYRIKNDSLDLFYQIEQNSETVGIVYLHADLGRWSRIVHFIGILFIVMLASFGISLWISNKLQRIISVPVLEIAAVANAVINRKNYSLRAAKYNADEIGFLADAFNQMLFYIQESDAKILAVNHSLKKEIAARKNVQESLEKNIAELARSNAELEQFAYVSSHDLQEPLRMVASYTQIIQKKYSDQFDEKGLLYLHYIVDGATRMQELIDDLLMFSRVGTRGKELRAVSLQKSLDIALHHLEATINESSASIIIDASLGPVTVIGDIVQLTQLFQNLMSNAIKFHGKDPVKVEIKAEKINTHWKISVKDNGIGIEREYFDRIFVIFQRLHGRTAYPGSGIGLAICKKIIERHGGRIWLESEVGVGTSFYFTLQEAK
jgi:signal transduction histidine kinase